jgi:hypothetical protein|tara:strand:+ start:1503 stop:1679 length:177 start_codon:yes stop_codon:yes gene_type:complete
MAHLAHPVFSLLSLVSLTNSCATPFGTLGTLPYLARETFLSFEKTLFALKSPLYRDYA